MIDKIIANILRASAGFLSSSVDKNVGGQAVIEGVMMRSPEKVCTALRLKSGKIVTRSEPFVSLTRKNKIFSKPILRGIISFFEMLVLGMRSLNFSADVFSRQDETEALLTADTRTKKIDLAMAVAIVLSLGLAILIFFFLPIFITQLLNIDKRAFGFNLVAGGVRVAIFLLYVWILSFFKDFRRVFEYDGFPQTTDGTNPNTLLKTMQFRVKAPGGVFFVTGSDDNGAPLGAMLPMGGQFWEPITPSPVLGSLIDAAPDAAWTGGDRHAPAALRTLQEQVLDLERRSTAQRDELAESRAENAALRAQLEDLALRLAELRRVMAGVPRLDGDFAVLKTGGAPRP